jgi:hypothetical protein
VPGFRFDGSGKSFQTASVETTGPKTVGMNWSDRSKHGQDFTRVAGRQAMVDAPVPVQELSRAHGIACGGLSETSLGCKVPSAEGRRTDPGKGARFTTRDCGQEAGIKCGGRWFYSSQPSISRMTSSKSPARKFASAMIAKIPLPLSRHIARTFYPAELRECTA